MLFRELESGLPETPSTLPVWLSAAPTPERLRLKIEEIRARITSMDPELAAESTTYRAAVVLLAGAHHSHNVDRLARFARLPREEVARCARRLVDNGVWRDGNTVARWMDDETDVESFWSDVAVAEGVLCRRMGDDGQPEWAPQGYWRKHYEYAGPREDEQPQVVRYHPHVEMAPQDLPFYVGADDGDDEQEEQATVVERRIPRPDAVPTVPDFPVAPVWLGGDAAAISDEPWREESAVGGSELFPEAVWLG